MGCVSQTKKGIITYKPIYFVIDKSMVYLKIKILLVTSVIS